MDPRPLRVEDQLALQEENSRLRSENEKMKEKKKAKNHEDIARRSRIKVIGVLFFAMILIVFGIGVSVVFSHDSHQNTQRTTTCYFVDHNQSYTNPWDKWYIFRSKYSGSVNVELEADGHIMQFDTQMSAWNFIQGWKLEACR